jgi:hypothetical protein
MEDKLRIKEAFKISQKFGDKIWKGWNNIPFTLLFITDTSEYLLNHPDPSSDFQFAGYDSTMETVIYKRQRVFQKNFLATFAAVNNINTVLMGTPENTGRESIRWIITAQHEHLHLLQYSDSGYTSETKALELSGNDSTGMWMLNYPFPYEDTLTSNRFSELMKAAKDAAFCSEQELNDKFSIYSVERTKFKDILSEKDYRYFSLQIWQEGIAKYTELKFCEVLKNEDFESTDILSGLKDYITYGKQYSDIYDNIKETSTKLRLESSKRVCFYYLGALEGILLDRINPNWRNDYISKKFYIENYYNYR